MFFGRKKTHIDDDSDKKRERDQTKDLLLSKLASLLTDEQQEELQLWKDKAKALKKVGDELEADLRNNKDVQKALANELSSLQTKRDGELQYRLSKRRCSSCQQNDWTLKLLPCSCKLCAECAGRAACHGTCVACHGDLVAMLVQKADKKKKRKIQDEQ